eukprot:TRINITY_DN11557_c0_g1_i1.p1 TRINITY_DN11557_c0_g1~~TRINITY_DN11557_c0_g1_i1.p1  ORF type:complete len:247 (+),score=48.16 TRINITY_DN11557_c0_g1_i1:155-895(+)
MQAGLLFLCFFLALSSPVLGARSWDRFRFIDQVEGGQHTNYVFRGNEPAQDGQMQYDWLVQGIAHAAQVAGLQNFPQKFYVIIFNLLEIEVKDWTTEKAFFEANPTLGKFVHYPIVGSLLNPMKFSKSVRKIMAKDMGSFDNMPLAMETITNLTHANYSLPAVVYIHCEAGKDRTGEVSGSYYISKQNVTFNQALYVDNKCVEGTRDISVYSRYALEWYCWSLKWGSDPSFHQLDCEPNSNYTGHC